MKLSKNFSRAEIEHSKIIYDWVVESDIEFDQMINEFDFSWIHISLKKNSNRKQILEAYKDDEGNTAYRLAQL